MTSDELRTAGANLREFLEMRGAKWDASMFEALAQEVAPLSEAEFYAALRRCKAELRYPPLPVDITDRCPSLAVQSADEAWTAIGSSSERNTVVCTDLTLAAWGEVASEPDPTARRMAFRKAYERLANAYKTAGRRPSVQVSLGTDPHGRIKTYSLSRAAVHSRAARHERLQPHHGPKRIARTRKRNRRNVLDTQRGIKYK